MTGPGIAGTSAAPPTRRLTFVLVGGGSLTVACGQRLLARGHQLLAVVTDAPEVERWATEAGARRLPLGDGSGAGWVGDGLADADVLLSVVNLTLLGPAAVRLPRLAAVNFHDGPLPAYAGLNVTSWALLNGEAEHAVSWHLMREAVDAGDVLVAEPVAIDPDETAHSLNAKCFEAGLRSFDRVLARLEAGDLAGRPQGDGPRRVFGRASRPPLGGVLDPTRRVDELVALSRALDFGPYPNPIGLPALVANGRMLLVGRVAAASMPAGAASAAVAGGRPGELLAVDAEGLLWRCADGAVRLSDLRRIDGGELSAPAAAELGLVPGALVAPPAAAAVADFASAMARWARHEEAWVERLSALEPLAATYLGSDTPGAPGEASPVELRLTLADVRGWPDAGDEPAGDRWLAAAAWLFARLAPSTSGDLPLRHPALARTAGVASAAFASHVPLRVTVPPTDDPSAALPAFVRDLRATIALGGHTRDLARRQPALARLDAAWVNQRWPLALARVAALEEAPDGPTGADADGAAAAPSPRTDADPALELVLPDDGQACLWRYDPARCDRDTVERLHQRLQAFAADLRAGIAPRDARVHSERDAADLNAWNRTERPLPPESAVHRAIEAQAARTPRRIALEAGRESLTYAELEGRANRLARLLRRRGVHAGDRVGVMTDRSGALLVAVLAILKAGAAYVPLDPDFPAERLAFMADDAELAAVVTHRAVADGLQDFDRQRVVWLDDEAVALAAEEPVPLELPVAPHDLAYVIYTSGSTGRPKGVMLEHGQVLNFFVGMDERLDPGEDPGRWLAVTSISFDISVLELLWTLARGFTVVLYAGDDRRPVAAAADARIAVPPRPNGRPLDLSLFYFSSDAGSDAEGAYRLLLEGARFADAHGFSAVWTPERHFHAFGGLYPNPAVTGAAIAAVTQRVRIRAGSCVLPLHHPLRVAEEWAVVDNLSNGRVDVSFATGWQPHDFVLAPDRYHDRHRIMAEDIETVRALWRGDSVTFPGPDGEPVTATTLPRPVQPELPVWLTAAGNPATFRAAGAMGAGILTHLLGQDLDELAGKIAAYREAWSAGGHPGRGHVALMLHTFVGDDPAAVLAQARGPLRAYLESSAGLIRQFASSFPTFRGSDTVSREALDARFQALGPEELEALLDHAVERYYATSGLFGTVDDALATLLRVRAADVDEVACLIDFGIPTDFVLDGLKHLAEVLSALHREPDGPATIPDLIDRHAVESLQCTPSMARMLVADPRGRASLASLRRMLVGGEALPLDLARTLGSLVGGPLLNMYGPTETTVWSTVHELGNDALWAPGAAVSIGTPIANTRVFVCDQALQPLPPGVPGELVIGGAGVARGYWRRPETTAERFVPDTVSARLGWPEEPGRRLYRTGDLACWRPDGTLEYLGRLDFQVKVRGHRIELGEIEAVLDEHPAVLQSVVVALPGEGGDARLVAYVQNVLGARTDAGELRRHVAGRLPQVMVPTAVVRVDAFPLTPNRKIDRRALPAPGPLDVARDDDFVAPSGSTEEMLAEVWRRVLSVERIGVHDDFFDSGGNSLLAVFAVTEMSQHGFPVTLGQLLRNSTITGLVAEVAVGGPGATA